ncbi:MAG: hypothetical protein MI976_11840 [Pseudomonadales bacterium]|nr:hypothetical protein [Pseudomonadales bacterium]
MFIHCLLQRVAVGVGLIAASMVSNAANITLVPSDNPVLKDQSFTVDLVISDLQSTTVGLFDIELDFQPTLMTWDGYSLNNYLGQPSNRFDDAEMTDANTVKVIASTALWPGQLNQPDAFVLATIEFTATAPGTAEFSISEIIVADDTFNINPILIDPISNSSIQIFEAVAEPVQVPLPAAAWWLSAVLMAWIGFRKVSDKAAGC